MNWSMKNDPKFGASAASHDIYKGTWWMQANGNTAKATFDDTLYVASWITWDIGGKDAFAYDGHLTYTPVVGEYCNSKKQTFGYTGWNGDAVTNNDYSRWASAMDAYRFSGARHSSSLLNKYGVTSEKLGDYIMIEWCEGNLQYNMKTLPVPDYQNYTGMGSIDYEKYFTTCSTLSTKLPTSREWNYSSKEDNVMNNSN
jgi:hypothetical protein